MKRTSFDQMACSLAQTLEAVGDWWAPLIVRDVSVGINRFDDLVRDLGISRNLLTERLVHLIAAGVLTRRCYQDKPERFEYELTEAGRDLIPIMYAIMAWGDRWRPAPEGQPVLARHKCGAAFSPRICCDRCGEPLKASDITPVAGPGGRSGPGTHLWSARLPHAE